MTKLNGMVTGTEWEGKSLDDIMLKAPAGGLFNNAAQSACRVLACCGLRQRRHGA